MGAMDYDMAEAGKYKVLGSDFRTRVEQQFTVLSGKLALQACEDFIIVKEDKFKTGYECQTCDGKGHLGETCTNCLGTGQEPGGGYCRVCNANRDMPSLFLGYKPCRSCNGTGTKNGIVIPETSKRRPTTGEVVSVGPKSRYQKGDHVLYGNYSGHGITYKGGLEVRILSDKEVLCLMYLTGGLTEDEAGTVKVD